MFMKNISYAKRRHQTEKNDHNVLYTILSYISNIFCSFCKIIKKEEKEVFKYLRSVHRLYIQVITKRSSKFLFFQQNIGLYHFPTQKISIHTLQDPIYTTLQLHRHSVMHVRQFCCVHLTLYALVKELQIKHYQNSTWIDAFRDHCKYIR